MHDPVHAWLLINSIHVTPWRRSKRFLNIVISKSIFSNSTKLSAADRYRNEQRTLHITDVQSRNSRTSRINHHNGLTKRMLILFLKKNSHVRADR